MTDLPHPDLRHPDLPNSDLPNSDLPHPLLRPFGKDRLSVLGETPLVAETPEHLLDDETTPIHRFFVRNNGLLPQHAVDPEQWRFVVDGEVEKPASFSVVDLKRRFETKIYRMVLECGGNGRSFFAPPAEGNPWTNGGVGCAEWTGVSLRDVLQAAGIKDSASHTAHFGADPDKNGDAKPSISRGMPIAKATDEHTLLVFGMNGEPLPFLHGGPLRLIVPGWPGSLSQKWLTRIWLRDREHDGPGMTGLSYRVPVQALAPGADAAGTASRVLESMPARSIVSSPAHGATFLAGTRQVEVRGAAWAGDEGVTAVDITVDGGATWIAATLTRPQNRYDWTRWTASVPLPTDGYFEIHCRATDSKGRAQPFRAPNWNPNGYGCNVMHRVAVTVGPAT